MGLNFTFFLDIFFIDFLDSILSLLIVNLILLVVNFVRIIIKQLNLLFHNNLKFWDKR